jgi:transposase
MQKNMTPGRRKGCPNYSPEFKQQLVAASCEPGYPSQNWRLKMALMPICF